MLMNNMLMFSLQVNLNIEQFLHESLLIISLSDKLVTSH